MRIYVDANVYLDYLLERENLQGEDLSKVAGDIFIRAVQCEFEIIVTNLVLRELEKHIAPERLRMVFTTLGVKALSHRCLPEDTGATADETHARTAARLGAIVVTRNINHFGRFGEAKRPEEL